MAITGINRGAVRPLAMSGVAVAFAALSMAQSPAVTVSSANLAIGRETTDSYTVKGSFSNISIAGANAIVFGMGQYGAAIPMSAFVQQSGTGVYQYQDTTGLTPYWLSAISIDTNAKSFTETAKGIALAGLTNPFPLVIGTNASSACGMVRVRFASPATVTRATRSVSAIEEYELDPGDPPTGPCLATGLPMADPPAVPVGTATPVTFSLSATSLDAKSVQLFRADQNAHPIGPPLCTFTSSAAGKYSCTASFDEPVAGAIPLSIEATSSGSPVLLPGFSIRAFAPISAADMQQLTNVENTLLQAGEAAYANYGDSVAARVQVLTALRSQMRPQRGLNGQQAMLSPAGSEISIISDAGIPINYTLSEPEAGSSGGASTADISRPPTVFPASRAPAPQAAAPQPRQAQSLNCGDFSRPIVHSTDVLVWDPGAIFFAPDPAPFVANVLESSGCPAFLVAAPISGPAATVASVAQFANYGTILMNTHGGFDGNGRYFILSGELSTEKATDWGGPKANIQTGTFCFRKLPVFTDPKTCYRTIYPNYSGWSVAPNSIVYGGFCDGFPPNAALSPGGDYFRPTLTSPAGPETWVSTFASGPNNAFIGFSSSVSTQQDAQDGAAIFGSMLHSYTTVAQATSNAGDPQLIASNNGQFLAYVGNPQLQLTSIKPSSSDGQVLAASLEGTELCVGNPGEPPLYVKWTNPAQAGHLTTMSSLLNGSQDHFTNAADCGEALGTCEGVTIPNGAAKLIGGWALAQYAPFGTASATSDQIMADFYPDPSGPVASRGCLTVQANAGLFVEEQLATTYNGPAGGFAPKPVQVNPPQKVTGTYPGTISSSGSLGGTASIMVTPNGTADYTVTISVGGAYPMDGYALIDLSAVNPGPAGVAKVQISGKYDTATLAALVACSSQPTCNFADGTILINSGASGNISTLDKGAFPFNNLTVDSSSSPVDIYVGMNSNDLIATQSTFTVILDIKFLNQ